MKKIVYFVASLMMLSACSDSFLKEEPVGEFMPDQVNDPANVCKYQMKNAPHTN